MKPGKSSALVLWGLIVLSTSAYGDIALNLELTLANKLEALIQNSEKQIMKPLREASQDVSIRSMAQMVDIIESEINRHQSFVGTPWGWLTSIG